MRPAASQSPETGRRRRCMTRALVGAVAASLFSLISTGANAQASDRSSLVPPVNHETGRIETVLTASDEEYRFKAYVLTWRSTRIVVAGAPEEPHAAGDNLNVVVYRSEIKGHKVLRFESKPENENAEDADSTASSASITQGTARIEDAISAESDGYRFVGYFVSWHDKRVFVVDPQSGPTRAIGESINFRVLRTGTGASRRLSFSL
jgi:hypothetical protein